MCQDVSGWLGDASCAWFLDVFGWVNHQIGLLMGDQLHIEVGFMHVDSSDPSLGNDFCSLFNVGSDTRAHDHCWGSSFMR